MDEKRFLKCLHKKLDINQKKLFSLVKVESRKDSLAFRMPVGLVSLNSIWEKIQEVGEELHVKVSKVGLHATLGELDELLGEIEWLWEGWVPKGFVTMVAGDPGIGKSAIVQYLVKLITAGDCFPLDAVKRKPGEAIWIDTEASHQILKVRARTMQINKERVYLPIINGDILSQANLGLQEDRQQITNLVQEIKPDALILDSLAGSHSRGENKVEEVRPVLEYLAVLARDEQIAVIIIHHLNKGQRDESTEVSLYRIRGSTAITGYCRSILAIEPAPNKKRKLRVIKSNLAKIGDPISVTPELDTEGEFLGFSFEPYIPPPPKKNRKEACAEWVCGVLREREQGIELTELVELGTSVGYSRSNIYASRDILGDQIMFTGTGNKAFWHIVREDKKTISKIISGVNGKVKHGRNKKSTQGVRTKS